MEVRMLYDLCNSSNLHPVQPKKRKEDVILHLPNCKIFHFAGHGHTDNDDPSQSALLLEDWEGNPLTVADLLDMNLREHVLLDLSFYRSYNTVALLLLYIG
jgi:CHAT domain-containing protein